MTTSRAPYAQAYEEHGRKMTEGVREIVWSGGTLQSDHYDEFVFMGRIAPHAKAPATIFAPVVQECANGHRVACWRADEASALRKAAASPATWAAVVPA